MTTFSFSETQSTKLGRTLALKSMLALCVGGANFVCAIAAAEVQPIELRAVASFHWQWLNHNILSADMLSHGIQLWPIAKQQGYLWLSLIGWSLSTKLKGHIPGTQPEAETGSSLLAFYFTLSLILVAVFFLLQLTTNFVVSLSRCFCHFSPHVPSLQLFQITIAPLPLSLCCVIVSGLAKQGSSRPEVTIPLWLTSWSFISMATVLPNSVTVFFSFLFFLQRNMKAS